MQPQTIGRRAVMAGLGAGLVAPSLGMAQDTAGGAAFALYRQKIFLPVTINGVEADAYLDTGVTDLLIDPAFAAKAGVEGVRDVTVAGWGSRRGGLEADGVTLRIAGAEVTGRATLADVGGLRRSMGRDFDVLVGRSLFDAFLVEIDFDQARLWVRPRDGFAAPPGAALLPLTRSGGDRACPIRLEGQGPFPAAIDLGTSMALAVDRRLADRLRLLSDRAVSTTVINAVGGMSSHPILTAGAFAVGPFDLPDAPVVVFDDLEHPAVIGMPVISRFHCWIDFGGRRLWLKPGAQASRLFDKDRVGLFSTAEDDGSFRVIGVAPGSPAEASGFVVGDRLAGVNGQALTTLRALDPPPPEAGRALSYQMADGSVRSLVTADYY